MKKVVMIILMMVAFSVYGEGDRVSTTTVNTNSEVSVNALISLTPITPKEATFEEEISIIDINMLKPITPKEATFDEDTTKIN